MSDQAGLHSGLTARIGFEPLGRPLLLDATQRHPKPPSLGSSCRLAPNRNSTPTKPRPTAVPTNY
jgi:hypothetical protein